MVALLPLELLQSISQKCPCRDTQIRQFATIYNDAFPSPPVLVAYGLEQSSKLEVIKSVLDARRIAYAVVRSKDCLSQRHLLSKIFATCIYTLGQEAHVEQYDKVDSANALLGNLRRLFEQSAEGKRMVLILDGVDQQKLAGPTLLPALARLGDQIPGLSLILTSSSPRPLPLHKSGVPYVHFPPYTRAEAVYILTSSPMELYPDPALVVDSGKAVQMDQAALAKLHAQFVVTVYDSLISSTSSTSIQTFRSTCEKLWPRFIWPMVSGQSQPGNATSWDFAKLLVKNRGLFQARGESALHEQLRPIEEAWSFADLAAESNKLGASRVEEEDGSSVPNTPSKHRHSTTGTPSKKYDSAISNLKLKSKSTLPPLLKDFPTLLLLSSYLASTTPSKHDILLFSRLSSGSAHISKKIRRLKNTPTRNKKTGNAADSTPTTKSRITKSLLSGASHAGASVTVKPFSLERLLAILRAVHPSGIPNRAGKGVADRVYRELGELERLRLVVRASYAGSSGSGGGSGAGAVGADDAAAEERWRVNVGRDWVVAMGKVWDLSVSEYEIEGDM